MMSLNRQAAVVHAANEKWWTDIHTRERLKRDKSELLMLIVSELSEAMEGERKGLNDDKLTHRPMAEVEMVDVVIRALDYAAGFGHQLEEVEPITIRSTDNRAASLLSLVKIVCLIDSLEKYEPKKSAESLSRLIASCKHYCEVFNYDFDGAFEEKNDFNRTRVDHTLEARQAVGGKKW